MTGKTLERLCNEAHQRYLPLLARRGKVLELKWTKPPRPQASFGLISDWVRVGDEVQGTLAKLLVPFQPQRLGWVKGETLRLFCFDPEKKALKKVKNALIHVKYSVLHATIDRAGVYGLIGLHTHPLVQETIRLLCAMKPMVRALPEGKRRAIRDRLCEVILCARDMNQFWVSRERLVDLTESLRGELPDDLPPPLPFSATPRETICDRCHGIDILGLPECHILDELATRPSRDNWPLGQGYFHAGFRLISDIPINPNLEGTFSGDWESTPTANAAISFYPATADGENAPFVASRFPLIIFGHAKRLAGDDRRHDFRQVSEILAQLARWGFVSIAADLSWLLNNIPAQQIALTDAGNYMLAEDSRSASPFRDKLRTDSMGVMGHSSGGAAATRLGGSGVFPIAAMGLIAPVADTESIASFAPKPVLIIHGTRDSLTGYGVGDQPLALFAAAGPKKHLVTIEGANHFGYTDELYFADDTATISRADQQRIAKAFLTAFFRRYLMGITGVNDEYLNGSRIVETLEAFSITVEAQV
jgi:dienelactone hydrolase